MTKAQAADEESDPLEYEVRLLIKHPSIDPDRITRFLGLIPNISANVGSARKTPAGTVLPGAHKASLWSYSFGIERNRFFFSDIVKMMDKLEPHKALIAEITDTGGSIDLIVNLPGSVNIGDIFKWPEMARLYALRINLGIEVFPKF